MKPALTAFVLGLTLIIAAVSTVQAKSADHRGNTVTPTTLVGE